MTYEEWMATVPRDFTDDAIWQMKVYRFSLFAADLCWHDVSKLVQDKRTVSLADQLFRATGSVSANISEGYSRQSGKDQARFYEYALGSAREARNRHYQGRHVLGEKVASHRIQLLTQIIRLLLTLIPSERGYAISDDVVSYEPSSLDLLNDPALRERA